MSLRAIAVFMVLKSNFNFLPDAEMKVDCRGRSGKTVDPVDSSQQGWCTNLLGREML